MNVDTDEPPAAPVTDVLPEEVVVARDRTGLRIVWPDGRDVALAACALRAACRCAWCTRDRILGRFRAASADVGIKAMESKAMENKRTEIRAVEALGSHGLHITFSDGHERGIYPWPYLDELARGQEAGLEHRTEKCAAVFG